MIVNRRKIAWAAVALACGFSGWVWLHTKQDDVSPPTSTAKSAFSTVRDPVRPRNTRDTATQAGREPLAEAAADPFKIMSFLPLPKPVEVAAVTAPPPTTPVAPPFPYRYLGRMLSVDGTQLTYLARGDAIVPIHLHQVLDTDYRIDKLNDTELVVVYLPLNEPFRIAVRSAEN